MKKRDLQTCSFKTPEFIKILVTVYLTLQVLAVLYTGMLPLPCSSLSASASNVNTNKHFHGH